MMYNRKKIQPKLCSLVILLILLNTSLKSATFYGSPEVLHFLDSTITFFVDIPDFDIDYDSLTADIDDPDDFTTNRTYSYAHILNGSGFSHYKANFFALCNYMQAEPELIQSGFIFKSTDLPPPSFFILS